MAKAVWNGFLRLSLVSCPVRLSPAIAESKGPRLEQLNGRTGNPVTQQFLDAKTGDVVAADAVAKGAAVEGGSYVALSEKELAGLSEEPSNIIDVMQFVPAGRVDRALLETRYYIYPEDELASDTLHAVWVAMQRSSRVGIGRVHLAERGRFA